MTQNKDTIIIQILEDGTIKTLTGPMGGSVNHSNAEEFLRSMERMAGCEKTLIEKNFELDLKNYQPQVNRIKA